MTPQAYFSILSRMPPKYSLWKFVFPSIDRLKVSLADRHIQKFLPQRKLKLAMSLLIASSAHSIRKKSQNEREIHTKQNSCAGYWLLNFIFCWFFVCVYFYLKKAKKKNEETTAQNREWRKKFFSISFSFEFSLLFLCLCCCCGVYRLFWGFRVQYNSRRVAQSQKKFFGKMKKEFLGAVLGDFWRYFRSGHSAMWVEVKENEKKINFGGFEEITTLARSFFSEFPAQHQLKSFFKRILQNCKKNHNISFDSLEKSRKKQDNSQGRRKICSWCSLIRFRSLNAPI